MSWDESEIAAARRTIIETANGILSGTISPIEGARGIARDRFPACLENDPDVLPFVGIVSETEALPLGSDRAHWQAKALADLQAKIDESQAWARKFGTVYCQNLVTRSADLLRWPE
jgi:hypothetical protein